MQTIKAIETKYKDYRFRSRLEARWAVFFDALGVKWEYEKEALDIPAYSARPSEDDSVIKYTYIAPQWYLPDFYLPQHNYYIEIKGVVDEEALIKPCALAAHSSAKVFVFSSIPSVQCLDFMSFSEADDQFGRYIGKDANPDFPYVWGYCNECKQYGIGFSGWGHRLMINGQEESHLCKDKQERKARFHPSILAAYAAARSARFEHGETPQ
jgi:hypothetical protein